MGTFRDQILLPGTNSHMLGIHIERALATSGFLLVRTDKKRWCNWRSDNPRGRALSYFETSPDGRTPVMVVQHHWGSAVRAPWPLVLAKTLSDSLGAFTLSERIWRAGGLFLTGKKWSWQ